MFFIVQNGNDKKQLTRENVYKEYKENNVITNEEIIDFLIYEEEINDINDVNFENTKKENMSGLIENILINQKNVDEEFAIFTRLKDISVLCGMEYHIE